MIQQMFSTPIGIYHYEVNDQLRSDVLNAMSDNSVYNFWKDVRPTNDLIMLRGFIESKCKEYVDPFFLNYMSSAVPVNVEGKVNTQYPGEYFPLHSHTHCHVTSVFYLMTPEDSGDLLLIDPRGDNNWTDRVDGRVSNVSYEKIKPTEGVLVFFPSYVSHMVEPNKSDKMRVSIVTNFYMMRGKV